MKKTGRTNARAVEACQSIDEDDARGRVREAGRSPSHTQFPVNADKNGTVPKKRSAGQSLLYLWLRAISRVHSLRYLLLFWLLLRLLSLLLRFFALSLLFLLFRLFSLLLRLSFSGILFTPFQQPPVV
jgi:hypothetical protein